MSPLTPHETFLLEMGLKGACVLVTAFAVSFALRRASASIRHAVWSVAFVALLLLPVGSAFLPAWEVGPQLSRTTPSTIYVGDAASAAASLDVSDPRAASSARSTTAVPTPDVTVAPLTTASERSASPLALPWMRILFAVWAVGSAVLLVRLGAVLFDLSKLRRRAALVQDERWVDQAECIVEVLDVRRPVRLLQHADVDVPMTCGVLRPVVFLPAYATEWSREQVHATLMHELLHVKRYDHLVQVLALAARALHWFNPLAWAASKQLVVERERACDDGVLAMGVSSSSYADHLLTLARKILSGREAPKPALAMARPSELHTRIVAILDPAVPRRSLSRLRGGGVVVAGIALFVALAAMQPPSVQATQEEGARSAGDLVDVFQLPLSETQPAPETTESVSPEDESPAASPTDETTETLSTDVTAEGYVSIGNAPRSVAPDTLDLETQKRALQAISELPEELSVSMLTEIARTHSSPELRKDALFWLGQTGSGSVREVLLDVARSDDDPNMQKQAIFALSELDDAGGMSALSELARSHSNEEMRAEAVFWIGQEGGAAVVDDLRSFAVNDTGKEVQKRAVFALAEVEDGAGVPALVDLARSHPDPEVRGEAIFWLGESGDARAADVLMEIINQRGN